MQLITKEIIQIQQPTGSSASTIGTISVLEVSLHCLKRHVQPLRSDQRMEQMTGLRVLDTVLWKEDGVAEKKTSPFLLDDQHREHCIEECKMDETETVQMCQEEQRNYAHTTSASASASVPLVRVGATISVQSQGHGAMAAQRFRKIILQISSQERLQHGQLTKSTILSNEGVAQHLEKRTLSAPQSLFLCKKSFIEKYGSHYVRAIYYGKERIEDIGGINSQSFQAADVSASIEIPKVLNLSAGASAAEQNSASQAHGAFQTLSGSKQPVKYDLAPWPDLDLDLFEEISPDMQQKCINLLTLLHHSLTEDVPRATYISALEELHTQKGVPAFVYYWLTELLFTPRILPLLVVCFEEERNNACRWHWDDIRGSYDQYEAPFGKQNYRFPQQLENIARGIVRQHSFSMSPKYSMSLSGQSNQKRQFVFVKNTWTTFDVEYTDEWQVQSLPTHAKWRFHPVSVLPPPPQQTMFCHSSSAFLLSPEDNLSGFVLDPRAGTFLRLHLNQRRDERVRQIEAQSDPSSVWFLTPVFFLDKNIFLPSSKKRKLEAESTQDHWKVYFKLSHKKDRQSFIYANRLRSSVAQPSGSISIGQENKGDRGLFWIEPC
jgi:hypothetical protein